MNTLNVSFPKPATNNQRAQYGARSNKQEQMKTQSNMSSQSNMYVIRTLNIETGNTEEVRYQDIEEAMELFNAYCDAFDLQPAHDGHGNSLAMNSTRCILLRSKTINK